MNSDTELAVGEIAQGVGALVLCEGCGGSYIYAEDRDADSMVYAHAVNAWKSGDRAFRGMMTAKEVQSAVKSVLEKLSWRGCQSCRDL